MKTVTQLNFSDVKGSLNQLNDALAGKNGARVFSNLKKFNRGENPFEKESIFDSNFGFLIQKEKRYLLYFFEYLLNVDKTFPSPNPRFRKRFINKE